MSFGFIATNNNDQVLVSSNTRNLHFITKVGSPTSIVYSDNAGLGIRIAAYDFTCNATPVPFYTLPDTNVYYGNTRVINLSGNIWRVEIVKNGVDGNYPEVYIFADPRGTSASESYGMQVFRDDGTISFDSRLKPLTVTGGISVSHPSNPISAFEYALDPKYCNSMGTSQLDATDNINYNAYSINLPSKPMFFFPSLAQAEREASWSANEEECDGVWVKGNCVGAYRNYNWNSTYWTFYRGGIKKQGNQVLAGWMIVDYGCYWTYSVDSVLFGLGNGGGSGSSGIWPYSNETLNLSAATLIIGDASRYD